MIYFVGNTPLIESPLYKMSTINECVEYFKNKKVVQLDTETEGEFNFNNKILLLQLGDKENQWVIEVNAVDCSKLKDIICGEQIKLLHNAKFDYKFIKFHFGWEINNIYDTFLAECIITNGLTDRKLGLKDVCEKYCKYSLNKSIRGKINKTLILSDDIIKYAAEDVTYLEDIREKQLQFIRNMELENVLNVENRVTSIFADIEYEGLVIDTNEWKGLSVKAEEKSREYEKQLDELVIKEPKLKKYCGGYQGDLFDVEFEKKTSIVWSSPTQLLRVFRDLGLKIDSTGSKDISRFQIKFPLIKLFIDYKKQQKLATTYGEEFLSHVNKHTGKIHTEFWQILDTYRVSSNNPNVQQIPSKAEYLACFKAPDGYSICGSDFSAQELRLIAEGSKEPKWVDAFNNGLDLHTEMAVMIFDNLKREDAKTPCEEIYVGGTKVFLRGVDPRFVAKTINFMLAYGGSEYKLADVLSIEVDAAKKIKDKYFSGVPKLQEFLASCAAYGVNKGYIRSFKPYSGIRFFDEFDTADFKTIGSIERASKNTPIQATGAIMCKLALIKIDDYIKDNQLTDKVKICLQIHDAIYTYAKTDFAEEWIKIQERLMIEAGQIFIKSIPVKSDSKITNYLKK